MVIGSVMKPALNEGLLRAVHSEATERMIEYSDSERPVNICIEVEHEGTRLWVECVMSIYTDYIDEGYPEGWQTPQTTAVVSVLDTWIEPLDNDELGRELTPEEHRELDRYIGYL